MRNRRNAGLFFLLPFLIFMGACNVTKPLKENEYLLIKNEFRIDTKKVAPDELTGYLQQVPNSKMFGLFRANIAFYNMGCKGKDSKFKKWLRTKLGAAPVLVDTNLSKITNKQVALYMNNKGYFSSLVSDSLKIKKKKATVIYTVKTTKPYTIRDITYALADTQIARFVFADTSRCVIKRGENYDVSKIDDERYRIAKALVDQGFYKFSTANIVFRVDSTLGTRQMNLTIDITNPVVQSFDNLLGFQTEPHKRFYINKIFVYTDFEHTITDTSRFDTLVKTYGTAYKGGKPTTYYFLHQKMMKVKPRTISQSIFITPGTHYNLTDITQTYSQLSSLQVYKFMNIQFVETPEKDSLHPARDLLNCKIQLAQSPVHSFNFSTDGTNSAGALGIDLSFSYLNKNIFRGAQLFKIGVTTSFQMQPNLGTENDKRLFNTFELGINASLTFPQFLIPIKPERLQKRFKPRTMINLGYNYQNRPDYVRFISNGTFGYSWNQNDYIRHELNPFQVIFVKIYPDSSFQATLDGLQDQRLKSQYENHLVAGLKYTFSYSNQGKTKFGNFVYFRTSFETGGNLFYAIYSVTGAKKNSDGFYTMFGIPYSTFIKPDVDFRYYNRFGKENMMVYRFYGGFGIPYWNSSSLPFEKAFMAGGTNDIRGWRMGMLGPGSFFDDTISQYQQIGDIQLQVNLEYRFPIIKFFKGALFLDAGNIWLLKESPDYPGGTFKIPGFINQVAIDVGIGIRADFNFFLLRIDPSIPIRAPKYPENDRWYFNKMTFSDIILNFGIGYPF